MPDWAWAMVTVVAILVVGAILVRLSHWGINRVIRHLEHEQPAMTEDAKARARTLGSVAKGSATFLIALVTVLVALEAAGLAIGPILAAAGIAGVALGFGAQTLVKDWIAGFFIVFERQFDLGDYVEVAGFGGTVEEINLRSTVLRSLDGARHVVSNNQIQISSNHTKLYSRYLFVLGVSYDADLERAKDLIAEVGEGMRRDPRFTGSIEGPVTVLGVDNYGDSSVDIKAYVQTTPGEQWRVGRELRQRLKVALDAAGIEIPFPHRELIIRSSGDGIDEPGTVRMPGSE
jgi:small conductance mechanosensitive channel